MIPVRKATVGGAAGRLGGVPWSYEWHDPGDVVDLPLEIATELMAMQGCDFEVVTRDQTVTEPNPQVPELSEIDPGPEEQFAEAEPTARKTTARRTSTKA